MTIYFDCTNIIDLKGNPTGIPRTVLGLAEGFMTLAEPVQFVTLSKKSTSFHILQGEIDSFELEAPATFYQNDVLVTAGSTWSYSHFHDAIRLIKNHGVRYFQVFYDLIPALYPYFYKDGLEFGSYFLNWNKKAYSLCDGAFAISESSKIDILSLLTKNQEPQIPTNVIRLGEDFHKSTDNQNDSDRFARLGSFLLSVGTIEIRKNHAILIDAFRQLESKHGNKLPKLLIVGNEGWNDGGIKYQIETDPILSRYISIETNVSDIELDWLYKNCLFSLYPSWYEGWGLPVSESLRNGRPCICSGTSSMLEIDPDLTVFASPYCVDDWIASISYFLEHPKKIETLAKKIQVEYKQTKWKTCAKSILHYINGETN